MWFKRPLQITILHKYENPPPPEQPKEPEQPKDENKIPTLDDVVKAVNDAMGVNSYGSDNK
jgi:hypothetical protein